MQKPAEERQPEVVGAQAPVEGVGGLRRITSYNVCYTKLLRVWELKLFGLLLVFRITSYNVCYTKLLRRVRLENARAKAMAQRPGTRRRDRFNARLPPA